MNVKPDTSYNWVKDAAPSVTPPGLPGTAENLRAQLAAVRKENRELARANEIARATASFFGAAISSTANRMRRAGA